MKKRKLGLAVCSAVMIVMFTACAGETSSSKFAPTQSSIFVSRKGTVQSALVETYENDYYSEKELSQFLKESVRVYNEENKTDVPVALVSCKLADGTASAVFSYGSGEDFVRFAEAEQDEVNALSELYVMNVSEGLAAGLILDGNFVKAKSKEAVEQDKITRQSELYMAAASGSALIQTEGKVQYMSEGCELVDDFTVQTPEEGRAYIIFK